jgi:transcriptional regulator with XRE-family HTH domain
VVLNTICAIVCTESVASASQYLPERFSACPLEYEKGECLAPIILKEIAKKLHISPSTVSRALRNHPKISPETKKRVIALADRYDYQPDSIAKSLQNGKTNTIDRKGIH